MKYPNVVENLMATKRIKRKFVLLGILGLVVIMAGVYWYVATEKFSDTKDREAAFTVSALDFIREFTRDADAANAKYRDQIVALNGVVSEVELADTTLNVKFIDPETGSLAIFAFQQQHLAEAKTVKAGDSISIKGSCSGGVFSEILEVHKIDFKRSTLN